MGHSKESESNTRGILSGDDGGCDGIEQNIEPSYMTGAIDYVDDASSQGLADHEIAFLREDLDLFKHDWITDPMVDYDESDSDDSVRDARRRIAHVAGEVETSDSIDTQFKVPSYFEFWTGSHGCLYERSFLHSAARCVEQLRNVARAETV
jgi:hypothetical protein